MDDWTTEQRRLEREDAFAYIDSRGERHLPIYDEEHVRNAIQRFGQTHFESPAAREEAARRILGAAMVFDVHVNPDDEVSRAANVD